MTDQQQPAKKKRGRPAKEHRPTFSFRLANATRARLQEAADSSGLSLSEEIERRLDRSFENAGVIAEMFGGIHIARLMNTFAMSVQIVEAETGRKFNEDEVTNLAVKDALIEMISLIKTPSPDPHRPPITLATLGRTDIMGSLIDSHKIGLEAAHRSLRITREVAAKLNAEAAAQTGVKKGGKK